MVLLSTGLKKQGPMKLVPQDLILLFLLIFCQETTIFPNKELQEIGEYIMRVSRFIPDFKNLSGNAKVTMFFTNYPATASQSSASGSLITGPFTINTTTNFISTRVRGRQG